MNPDSGQGSQLSLTPRLSPWGRASLLPNLLSRTLPWTDACPAPCHRCAPWMAAGPLYIMVPSCPPPMCSLWFSGEDEVGTLSIFLTYLSFYHLEDGTKEQHWGTLHVRFFVHVPTLSWWDLNGRLDNIANTNKEKKRKAGSIVSLRGSLQLIATRRTPETALSSCFAGGSWFPALEHQTYISCGY